MTSGTTQKPRYRLEDVREFLIRRTWLVGDTDHCLVTALEYQALRARTATFPRRRVEYFRAYIAGWFAAQL